MRIVGESGAMRPSSVPRRPATSARIDAANVEALRTISGGDALEVAADVGQRERRSWSDS